MAGSRKIGPFPGRIDFQNGTATGYSVQPRTVAPAEVLRLQQENAALRKRVDGLESRLNTLENRNLRSPEPVKPAASAAAAPSSAALKKTVPAAPTAPSPAALKKPAPAVTKPTVPVNRLKKGDTLTFGRYPQDVRGALLPIEWQVLSAEDGKVLVISKKALDVCPFDAASSYWNFCNLRAWLNGELTVQMGSVSGYPAEFLTNRNFTAEEQAAMLLQQGRKVSVLGYYDVARLLPQARDRWASPTAYALTKRPLTDGRHFTKPGEPTCCWWLRTAGIRGAAYVGLDGGIMNEGCPVSSQNICVRPVLLLDEERLNRLKTR